MVNGKGKQGAYATLNISKESRPQPEMGRLVRPDSTMNGNNSDGEVPDDQFENLFEDPIDCRPLTEEEEARLASRPRRPTRTQRPTGEQTVEAEGGEDEDEDEDKISNFGGGDEADNDEEMSDHDASGEEEAALGAGDNGDDAGDLELAGPSTETDEQRFLRERALYDGLPVSKTVRNREAKAKANGYIQFTKDGELEYSRKKDGEYEPAVFHHWIREPLAARENRKGYYGLRNDPRPVSDMMWYGKLVIDWWLLPVKDYVHIPCVLASEYEGCFMEASMRLHDDVIIQDFAARMPPMYRKPRRGHVVLQRLCDRNALSARMRRFRRDAGCITWTPKLDSDVIKRFMDNRLKPENWEANNTKTLGDLDKAERMEYISLNHNTRSYRARPTATEESKAAYRTSVPNKFRKLGMEPPARLTTSQTAPEEEDEHDQPKQKKATKPNARNTMDGSAEREELAGRRKRTTKASTNHDLARVRTVNQGAGRLPTAEEGADQTTRNFQVENYALYDIPASEDDIARLRDLLRPTAMHFYHETGAFHPYSPGSFNDYTPTGNYVTEYQILQDGLTQWRSNHGRTGPAPELVRLEELNQTRAVWSYQWDEVVFTQRVDFGTSVGKVVERKRLRP
ncbi:MAG: hypothetical protein Q9217_000825 [Psora testacea]